MLTIAEQEAMLVAESAEYKVGHAQAEATRLRTALNGILHMDDYEMRKRFIEQALTGQEAQVGGNDSQLMDCC